MHSYFPPSLPPSCSYFWVNSMSGTGLHACLPFPSLIWIHSYSPSVSKLRDTGKCDRNPEFLQERDPGVTLSFLSCVIEEFLVTTWLFYTKKKAYSITKHLSNSPAISTWPCKPFSPIIHFSFQKLSDFTAKSWSPVSKEKKKTLCSSPTSLLGT